MNNNRKSKIIAISAAIVFLLVILIYSVFIHQKKKPMDEIQNTGSENVTGSIDDLDIDNNEHIILDNSNSGKDNEQDNFLGNIIITHPVTATPKPNASVTSPLTAAPTPSTSPEEDDTKESVKGKIIAIDAGHQLKGNSEKEPIGPGSSEKKPKTASGTTGVSTKVPEYKLTLAVSLKLRDELQERGYEVFMIREANDVDISNRERAELANEQADVFVRLHANGSDNSSIAGALTISPSLTNPYVSAISDDCKKLSEAVIASFCEATGAKNKGVLIMDNMSGINWCTIPVTIIEMGFMTNAEEDKIMQKKDYQDKMAKGIADGIDAYFGE